MTHICVSKLTITGSNNGLSPNWRQAIIWTNDGILLIGTLGTNFSEIFIEILAFSFKKMRLKVSSAKWQPFCLGPNVLKTDFLNPVDCRTCTNSDSITHLPLVLHICVSELSQHWFRLWLVAFSSPSNYINQCWFIVNCTLKNKLQWNFNQNTQLIIHENASENIVCEMVAILSRGRWVNPYGGVMNPCIASPGHRQWRYSLQKEVLVFHEEEFHIPYNFSIEQR